ncbi:diacylglycerol/lipid kinase family protein [Blastomonas sp.]|uniref:diacylglycerol/lipid kinase family protein n=1 Tax=Blastomonas sp. TaxID=1909299 RepID=UPI0039195670
MRALLVHNAQAGTDPVPRKKIEAVLHDVGIETIYCAHAQDDLADALRRPVDLVIAAGGDGTVADVVASLEDTGRPIAILPLGGSNNIAHALGVGGPWHDLPRRWSLDAWTRLDRCEADGPWGCKPFLEALGTGVLTDSFEETDEEPASPAEKRDNGRAAFAAALARAEPFHCAVASDEWDWEGDCLMIEAMNIGFVGSRLALAEAAVPDDGLLDVVIITPEQREDLLRWMERPDDWPCPAPARKAVSVRITVHERPIRLDDRSPDEDLTGTVDVRVRSSWVRILDAGEDG